MIKNYFENVDRLRDNIGRYMTLTDELMSEMRKKPKKQNVIRMDELCNRLRILYPTLYIDVYSTHPLLREIDENNDKQLSDALKSVTRKSLKVVEK